MSRVFFPLSAGEQFQRQMDQLRNVISQHYGMLKTLYREFSGGPTSRSYSFPVHCNPCGLPYQQHFGSLSLSAPGLALLLRETNQLGVANNQSVHPHEELPSLLMDLPEFWYFARLSNLITRDLSMADLNRCFFIVADRPEKSVRRSSDLPHDPTRCIVFREWVECLVRVAFAWYYQAAFSGAVNRKRMASVMRQASGASLSGELSVTSVTRADTFSAEEEDVEVSLSMFFEHLVEDCLIPLHELVVKSSSESKVEQVPAEEGECIATLCARMNDLEHIYFRGMEKLHESSTVESSTPPSPGPLLTVRNFLQMLQQAGVLSQDISVSAVAVWAVPGSENVPEKAQAMDRELLFPEFLESLLWYARFSARHPVGHPARDTSVHESLSHLLESLKWWAI